MRPVCKGKSPINGDYENYRDAFPQLQARIGPYCSYCERRIPTNLAVEHIQPKDEGLYPELKGDWDNYLLGCVNCNSTKKNKDVILHDTFLPDRDNTFCAFEYTPDGKVLVANGLSPTQVAMAQKLQTLVGLEKEIRTIYDENGRIVATDRISQRMEVWAIALDSKADLAEGPTDGMKRQIARLAAAHGFFSVWMKVFADDADMRQRFIDIFPGTAKDCFGEEVVPISPRLANHLKYGGKI